MGSLTFLFLRCSLYWYPKKYREKKGKRRMNEWDHFEPISQGEICAGWVSVFQ